MPGSQVPGQLPVGEARQIPALLPQKGLKAVQRRLVGPAGVGADAGAGQPGGGGRERRGDPGGGRAFFEGGGSVHWGSFLFGLFTFINYNYRR